MVPGEAEVERNPRARSAKLRAAETERSRLMSGETSNTRSRRTSATTRSSARSIASGTARCGARSASASFSSVVLLFSAWQHFELLRHGYRIEQMQKERADEDEVNRHLRLEIDTLRSPARIERLATERLADGRAGRRRRDGDRARDIHAAAAEVGRRPPVIRGNHPVAETPANAWRTTLKRRLVVAAVGLFCVVGRHRGAAGLPAGVRHADLAGARRAAADAHGRGAGQARRDSRSQRRVLAYSVDADSIYAVPTEIADPDAGRRVAVRRARRLHAAGAAGAWPNASARGRAFVYVRRQVSPDQARRVADLQLEGVGFMKENRRFYPNKELAAHVLGYVGIDNTGLAGIEATYDNLIKGQRGHGAHPDRRQAPRVQPRRAAADRPARSLELTIDEYLQHIVERELQAGVE